jgi:hypothetical protein
MWLRCTKPGRANTNSSMKTRQSLFIIIVGTNGTGKTTVLRNLVNTNRRLLVIDPDGMEWGDLPEIKLSQVAMMTPTAKARVIGPSPEELDMLINFENGNLVLDDCRYYVKSRIEESVRKTLVRRRQKSIDVYAVGHSLSEIPPTFWVFCTHLILFKTRDNAARVKQNIPKYQELEKVHIPEINRHADHHYYRIIAM